MRKLFGSDTMDFMISAQRGSMNTSFFLRLDTPRRFRWNPHSRRHFLSSLLGSFMLFLEKSVCARSSPLVSRESGSLRIRVMDEKTGQMIPCTIQVMDSQGKIVTTSENGIEK
jgi:hypothetical protein